MGVMARSTFTGRSWSLDIDQEMIDVTSSRPQIRESWRYTDRAGHEHYSAPGMPTLRVVVDESHWCDGTEGYAHHDPHEQIDESHYECPLCGEIIEPDTDPPYTPRYVAGSRNATFEGVQKSGRRIRAHLSADEVERLTEAPDPDAVANELADSLPEDRIISWEWRG